MTPHSSITTPHLSITTPPPSSYVSLQHPGQGSTGIIEKYIQVAGNSLKSDLMYWRHSARTESFALHITRACVRRPFILAPVVLLDSQDRS